MNRQTHKKGDIVDSRSGSPVVVGGDRRTPPIYHARVVHVSRDGTLLTLERKGSISMLRLPR
jgi:hypothetical protein